MSGLRIIKPVTHVIFSLDGVLIGEYHKKIVLHQWTQLIGFLHL